MSYTENSKKVFLNTGTRFQRSVIYAMGAVKLAAARANVSLGILDQDTGKAIERAASELMEGLHDEEIVVDVFQTGSGTGINMNVNEVLARRASEILGKRVHPNDHVNMSQSSNDVVPTAIRVAIVHSAVTRALPALTNISDALRDMAGQFSEAYKSGRTHLRDALPVTLGQELESYALAFERGAELLKVAVDEVKALPLGGTAVGTGLNTPEGFPSRAIAELNALTGLGFREPPPEGRFYKMKLMSDIIALSGVVRSIAVTLYRLSQDLRLMFSGPFTGLNEIDIPTQEEVAGSSIMPGKTNPVTVESCLQASVQVMGIDSAIQNAGLLGEFELSMGVPLTGYDAVLELDLISEALNRMADVVIRHIVPNLEKMKRYAESSPSLITIVSPKIGYDNASRIGKQLAKGLSIREALKELGYSDQDIDRLLNLSRLVKPGIPAKEG